jgi:hypothetical protein
MRTAEVEHRLREELPALTAGQPLAPPDRVAAVRRRHARRRQARLAGVAAVAVVVAMLGAFVAVSSSRTQGYARRGLPAWALEWPDRRDGSVPQPVLDGAVTAWARTAGAAGGDLVTVQRTVWYAGRRVPGTDSVIAVFAAETDQGRRLVAARATASDVLAGAAPYTEDENGGGSSPWSSFTTAAPESRQPDLDLSLHLPGTPSPDRPGSSPEVLYVLTDPRARGLLWSSDPPAGAPSGHVRGALNSDDGEFVGALGVIWAPVRISTHDAAGRQLSSSVAGIPGAPESEVPQLGRPDPIVLPPGWQLVHGVGGQGPVTIGGETPPPRDQAAVFVRCLGLGPVVVRLGARESLTAPCDGQQHQRNAGGPLLRPNPYIPDDVQASKLTTYQVVVAVRP